MNSKWRKFSVAFLTAATVMSSNTNASASNFTTSGWTTGFTTTVVSEGIVGSNFQLVATFAHDSAVFTPNPSPSSGQLSLGAGDLRLFHCNDSSPTTVLNPIANPTGCTNFPGTMSYSSSGDNKVITATFSTAESGYNLQANKFIFGAIRFKDSANNTLWVLARSGSGSGGSDSSETPVAVPSPKIPTINQMASGSLLVTPGTNAVLTGSRLNCTTYVKVNNVATTFTYSNLSDGSGQLSIAMPSSLRAGKHALTMDSCGGEVTYLNVLTVAKAPVELRLDLANASDRALGLIELRAFMREHRADYNTVTCTADSANRSQQKIASQVVARYCHEAFSRLAMPMNRTTSVKSDYQGRSLILTVSLSNR